MGVTVTYFGSGIRQELEPAEALRVVKLGLAWPDGGEEPRPERAVLAQAETTVLPPSMPRTKKPGKKRKPLKGY